MNCTLMTGFLTLGLALGGCVADAAETQAKRPNIVIILADDKYDISTADEAAIRGMHEECLHPSWFATPK